MTKLLNHSLADNSDMLISEHSITTSKGNQPKWYTKDNKFVKGDQLGYEGLSEFLCSRLLSISTCTSFVKYDMIKMEKNSKKIRGCISENFLTVDKKLITVYRLFQSNGINIGSELKGLSIVQSINHICDIVTSITGISDFKDWLISLLKNDFLVLNEDRHFNNIAVIYDSCNRDFSKMPVFDNGAALLSDVNAYPMWNPISKNIEKIKNKPFSPNFKKQFDACCEVSDACFRINYSRIPEIMSNVENLYTNDEWIRATNTLNRMLNIYKSVFSISDDLNYSNIFS